MKLRIEPAGLHWFDRSTGMHLLVDEVTPPPTAWSVAPRTLSIALSNACDLNCHFCYRPHNADTLPLVFVQQVATTADELGTLEITLGGGEPLLYPGIQHLCAWIWTHTSLGVSITTHGHHLTPRLVRELAGNVSSMRFSIDGLEPYYSRIRGVELSALLRNIEDVQGVIPFGINTVVSSGHLAELSRVVDLAIALGAHDLLVIPEHHGGHFALSSHEWQRLAEIITTYQGRCRLTITHTAADAVKVPCLHTEGPDDFVFAHLSADRKLKAHSYGRTGISIDEAGAMEEAFLSLHPKGGLCA